MNSNYELSLMMEAARTSETSVDNYFTRQYIPGDNSELHTRRRENLKSHTVIMYVNILDIHRPSFLKHYVSETGSCLHPQGNKRRRVLLRWVP
jgi:hypothetical protein